MNNLRSIAVFEVDSDILEWFRGYMEVDHKALLEETKTFANNKYMVFVSREKKNTEKPKTTLYYFCIPKSEEEWDKHLRETYEGVRRKFKERFRTELATGQIKIVKKSLADMSYY